MNQFNGVGKINEVTPNGKVLKFILAISQEKKSCNVPCLIYEPSDQTKKFLKGLCMNEQLVCLSGKLSVYEFVSHGKTIRKVEVFTYVNNIKAI